MNHQLEAESLLKNYFPDLETSKKEKLLTLIDLYAEWNDKINVVSRKDFDHFFERHILHSLAIAKFIKFPSATKILDIGTGGGLPGIPLAIMYPDSSFTLVDSIGKKIKVVKGISDSLALKNVSAFHERVENLQDKYHYIISRAVARTIKLKEWTNMKFTKTDIDPIKGNGYILLKGGDLAEELDEAKVRFQEINIYDSYFEREFFKTKKLIFIPSYK